MIIVTNKSDALLKRALGKGQTSIITIDKMLDQFPLDPTITEPRRDVYVVTNEDISAARLKTKFEQALLTKHPATKVLFINKSSKPVYPNGLAGLDIIIGKQNLNPKDITQAISTIISQSVTQDVAHVTEQEKPIEPGYTPPVIKEESETVHVVEETPTVQEELPVAPVVEPQVVAETPIERESALVERMRRAGTVSDVSVVLREINATNLIKDLIETNSTYAGIEEKLKSLNTTIFNIMGDVNIKSLDEKLSKIHAILHDKAFFNAKGDTLIEQRLEEVIDTICTRTSALLQSRLDEIDKAIKASRDAIDVQGESTRLAGINEQRANLIIELRTLEIEINDIFKATDGLIIDTATKIAEQAATQTDNEQINTHLKARGSMVLSDETITAIRAAMELSSDKVPATFKELKLKVINEIRLLDKLFELDTEIIAAQQEIINILKAKNVEDTVVAETLLKKSLRVFIGEENTGRTIIPYLLSKYKSRQNANVLLLDLTGTAKYNQYGIQYTNVDTYLNELNQREFMLVAGNVDNSVAAAQRIVTTLLKAADYYRVINIVLSTEQRELFETIAQDVLCVNFIVDTNMRNINTMRDVIGRCTISNVARRVIVNRCDVPIRPIIDKLGLSEQIDYQICTVPTVSVITDAGLNNYNPYGVSAVDLAMEEVLKHA